MANAPEMPDDEGVFDSNWPVPDEYLLELGRLVCVWNALEHVVDGVLTLLSGYDRPTDRRAWIMVAHSNVQQRLDAIGALCEQLAPDYEGLDVHEALLATIKNLQRAKTKYTTNPLFVVDGRVILTSMSARGTLHQTREEVHLHELRGLTRQVHGSIKALHELTLDKGVLPRIEPERNHYDQQ